ncbi:MAG: ThiF family adenylyltransferase [Prevotellaceae bacterium]|nr:ThiF family adenylyltransferase [Prevotellaceae bacterium]
MDIDYDKLRHATVMVIGCGALGNEVLKNLVLMGIGRLTIVDFDYVEQGNLTRSILFRKSDVGKRKVDAAASGMKDINPDVEVNAVFGDVAYDVGLGLFREADVVVGCVDSRWARYCIQRLALRAGKTWIDGGIIELEGTARVFEPGHNCYACSLGTVGIDELRRRMPCSGVIRRKEQAGHAPTTPIIASIIGAVQAQEAVKVAAGMKAAQRMLYYEGEHLTARIIDHRAWDDDCPLHETWQPIETIEGISLDTTVEEVLKHGDMLLNEPYVDYITDRATDEKTMVMCAAHLVEDFVERHEKLRYKPLGDFYQHEYTTIDTAFPYKRLTLRSLGLPEHDVIRLCKGDALRYVEIINTY